MIKKMKVYCNNCGAELNDFIEGKIGHVCLIQKKVKWNPPNSRHGDHILPIFKEDHKE